VGIPAPSCALPVARSHWPLSQRDREIAGRWYADALQQLGIGETDGARHSLAGLVRVFPEVAEYHCQCGRLLVEAECYATAEDELLRALRIDASDADAMRLLGDVYGHQRKRTLAEKL